MKPWIFSIFFFSTFSAFAANCETFTGHQLKAELCWEPKIKGWISARCLDEKSSCDVYKLLASPAKLSPPGGYQSKNPAAVTCHQLQLKVVVLKDTTQNEQAFCIFKDQSMVEANVIERKIR